MKRATFSSMTSILVLAAGVATAAPQPKVTICHFPPGNPANVQVITVGAPAVPAHVANHNDAVCPAGDSNCCFGGSQPSVCTDFATDTNNCGACGNVCSAGGACIGGSCVAATPTNTSTPTETPTNTPDPCAGVSCGDCKTCNPATGACVAVPDNTACGDGGSCCAGSCSFTSSDPNNCGACGTVCAAGVCTQGACGCPAGTVEENGQCFPFTSCVQAVNCNSGPSFCCVNTECRTIGDAIATGQCPKDANGNTLPNCFNCCYANCIP